MRPLRHKSSGAILFSGVVSFTGLPRKRLVLPSLWIKVGPFMSFVIGVQADVVYARMLFSPTKYFALFGNLQAVLRADSLLVGSSDRYYVRNTQLQIVKTFGWLTAKPR